MSALRIAAARTAWRAGERFTGRVAWRVPEQPVSAALRLFWSTSGNGTTDVEVVETVSFAAPRLEDQRDVELTLPREPYSFNGTVLALTWALELIVEPGGHVERLEIVISATGQPVTLGD